MPCAPNAREEHIHFARVNGRFGIACAHILIGLVGRGFHHTLPHLVAFIKAGGGIAIVIALILGRAGCVHGAIEQGGFAILVATQVAREGEHGGGGVFVQGQIGTGANNDERIARETDEYHQ